MSEEEDFSGLSVNEIFVDKRCKELEKVLKENSKYTKHRVVRRSWGKDWKLDPFFIQDEDENNLILLEPEMLDALSDSELLAFIDIEMKRIGVSEDTFWLFISMILLIPSAVFSPILAMNWSSIPDIIGLYVISLPLDLVILLLGTIYYRKRKKMISRRRHIDLIEARENPMFVSALQKLASIPNLERSKEYRNRLQYIEATLEGVSS